MQHSDRSRRYIARAMKGARGGFGDEPVRLAVSVTLALVCGWMLVAPRLALAHGERHRQAGGGLTVASLGVPLPEELVIKEELPVGETEESSPEEKLGEEHLGEERSGGSGEPRGPEAGPLPTGGAEPPPPPLAGLPGGSPPPLSEEQLEADTRSRTAYEGLDGSAAVALAERTFGIQRPVWTAPGSEPGTHVSRYLGAYTASEERPGGLHELAQSTTPLQTVDQSGELAPVSLELREEGGAFAPQNAIVPVSISKSLSAGVSFAEGTSMAPAEASPSASATRVGNHVVWPASGDDSDYMAEPVPGGVETSWQLRSEHSSEESSLVFQLAPEESLQMSTLVLGAAEVVHEGHTMLMIMPASARQADGESLAVSYSISGDVLATHVDLEGDVDFPVLVDPIVYGWYGEANGNGGWQDWYSYSTCGGCFGLLQYSNLLQAGAEYNWPAGNYGEWYTGVSQSNPAGITRADVANVVHQQENQSALNIGLYYNNGTEVYSLNGYAGASGFAPLVTDKAYQDQDMAFCAQGAGGSDGGSQPLCEECKRWDEATCVEAYNSKTFAFSDDLQEGRSEYNWASLSAATLRYIQAAPPTAELEEPYRPPKHWLNSNRETWHVRTKGEDSGLGVAAVGIDYEKGEVEARNMPNPSGSKPLPGSETYAPGCGDPFCDTWLKQATASLSGLGTGVWTLGAWAHNAVGLEAETTYHAYIDNTPPEIETPSWVNATFGDGSHMLNYSVKDGSPSSPEAGVWWTRLEVDGKPYYKNKTSCPEPYGIPAESCYGLTGNWTLNAEDWAPGKHVITITAQDWVGNESSRSFEITVERPIGEMQQVGPGALNLLSGDFKLSATDVSVPAGVADLTVSRTYDSQSSESGPLGPGWTLSTPDTSAAGQWQGLQLLSNGSVEAATTDGQKVMFTNESGSYKSPTGFQTYTLTEPSTNPVIYQITDVGGDYTQFEEPPEASTFMPASVGQAVGAGGLNRVTYVLREGRTTEIVGPEPEGVECKVKPLETKGCRTLMLNYAKDTTAKGEEPGQWGEYAGHLASVVFTAWSSEKNEMTSIPVAQYDYDSGGRLRAEWDPRVTPNPLKTVYGYNGEGQLSALTPSGQQPFLFQYGTVSGGTGSKWLLSVTRPSAKTKFGKGAPPVDTTAPSVVPGTARVGKTSTATVGQWGGDPLAYAYQWEACRESSSECAPIAGATNRTFMPQASDVGLELRVRVEAQSGSGATDAVSSSSSPVATGTEYSETPEPPSPGASAVTTIDYHIAVSGENAPYPMGSSEVATWGQEDPPTEATAIFPPDNPQGWPAADYKRATIYYFDSVGRRVNVASPGGAISTTEYETFDNVKRTLTPGNRQRSLESGAGSVAESRLLDTKSTYTAEGTELESSLGPQHEVKLAYGRVVQARAHAVYYYGPYGLVTKTTEGAVLAEGGEEEEVRTVKTSYSGQDGLGLELHKPTSITTEERSGKPVTRTIVYSPATGDVTETTPPAGSVEAGPPIYSRQFGSAGSAAGELKSPSALALDGGGDVWVADTANNRIEEFSSSGAFSKALGWGVSNGKAELQTCTSTCQAGIAGSGAGQLSEPGGVAYDEADGDLYVSDTANDRIEQFSATGGFVRAFGWGVSNGKAELQTCTSSCKAGIAGAGDGQLSLPAGLSADNSGDVWVADYANNRIEKFSPEGAYLAIYGAGEFSGVSDVALCDGTVYAVNRGGQRVQEISMTSGKANGQFGAAGEENKQFKQIGRIACEPENNDIYVTDEGMGRVEIFTPGGIFVGMFGATGSHAGQLTSPAGVGVSKSGEAYVVDSADNRVEVWTPVNTGAHKIQTIYYSKSKNSTYPECGEHAESADLPCRSQAAEQPGDNLPELPVTTTTYNIWDEPAEVARRVGSNTRTVTTTYDPAGRTLTSSVASTVGKALPPVRDEYDEDTGALVGQSTTSGGKTEKITSDYNSLGELLTYIDAGGNKSKYIYDVDGRVTKMSDGKGTQTYAYSSTTGELTELKDSAAGRFGATYNIEGQLETQTYPNGMIADYKYNPVGQLTSLAYWEKTKWYEDTVALSIHGQWISQESTLGADNYAYDNIGRLTEVQETPRGKDCTTSLYTYNDDSDRIGETKRESATASCATSGGVSTEHAYDTADRLADPETEYEPFGGDTVLPAADAGGHVLESKYYASGALYEQTQNGQTESYYLDPTGRVRETRTETLTSSKSTVSHYAGSGSTPAWVQEENGNFTRDIAGIGGGMCAVQTNKGVTIQIANLHGDIIGTVPDGHAASAPTFSSEPTAFGVPTSASSSKYGWLGAGGLQIEFAETGISSTSGGSYVPQLGINLAPEALSGSAAEDPVNEYLSDREEAEPAGSRTGTLPGAVEPLHANPQISKEFLENPPWDKPPLETSDPHWIWSLTISQAENLAGAIYGAKGYVSLTSIGALIKEAIGIDFVAQLEDAVEQYLIGFSQSQVEDWAVNLADGLSECVADDLFDLDHPYNAHCWVYVPTNEGSIAGLKLFEIPEFRKETEVAYCPHGASYCYEV